MNNVAIGGEKPFKKKYEEFKEEVKKFKEVLNKYNQIIQEKDDWANLQTDFWTECNTDFLSHLDDVKEFVSDLRTELRDIQLPEYPEKLY